MPGGVTREIITLQIGNYANYIGAHYFNLQDPTLSHNADIDHGILWRQVLTQQRNPIWTPRVLIFDLKDNYWSHRQSQTTSTPTTHFPPQPSPSTSLVQNSQNQNQCESSNSNRGVLWDGAVQYVDLRDEPVTPTPATSTSTSGGTDLNSRNKEKTRATQEENGKKGSEVKSWVDYTQWKLHWSQEKAAENRFSLPNFSHNPNSNVVSNYGQGLQIYTDMEDRITEAIRRYAEPCDYFQGFHVLADQEDGFGGLTSGILQHISDEYEKKTSLCFGLSRPRSRGTEEQFEDFKLRSLSTSLVWNSFSLHSSVFTSLGLTDDLFRANPQPVQLPHLNYNPDSAFESSAVLAAALDTLTLPYLQKSSRINFTELLDLLSGYGHKMTMVGSSFPFPLSHPETLFDVLNERGLDDLHSLTPGAPMDLNKSIGNFFVPRGFSLDKVIRRKEESRRGSGWHQGGSRRDEDGIRDAESCLQVYAQENCRKSVNVVRSIPTPFRLSHPFPALFTPTIFQTLNKSRAPVPSPWSSSSSTSTSGTSVSSGAGEFVWETPTIASAHNSRSVGDLLQRLVDVEVNTKKNFISSRSLLSRIPMMELDDYQECLDNLKVLRETYQPEY